MHSAGCWEFCSGQLWASRELRRELLGSREPRPFLASQATLGDRDWGSSHLPGENAKCSPLLAPSLESCTGLPQGSMDHAELPLTCSHIPSRTDVRRAHPPGCAKNSCTHCGNFKAALIPTPSAQCQKPAEDAWGPCAEDTRGGPRATKGAHLPGMLRHSHIC